MSLVNMPHKEKLEYNTADKEKPVYQGKKDFTVIYLRQTDLFVAQPNNMHTASNTFADRGMR